MSELNPKRLVHWHTFPRAEIRHKAARAHTEGGILVEAMILNVPPASGPHYCPSANLAP